MALVDFIEDPTQQLVILTLLSLLTPINRVPGPKPPYVWVFGRFKSLYAEAADGGDGGGGGELERDERLKLWVLLTVALIQDGVIEGWVVEAWNKPGFQSDDWAALRQRLVSVVWIGAIHDKLGQAAFRKLSGKQHLEGPWYMNK